MPRPLRFESKKGRICVAWVWNREGTEKLINGKQHSVWFVPTGMKGLPQNVLHNFRLEFPKSDLTIYLPSGISEIFRQMVSTPVDTRTTAWACATCLLFENLLPVASYSRRVSDLKVPIIFFDATISGSNSYTICTIYVKNIFLTDWGHIINLYTMSNIGFYSKLHFTMNSL